MTYHATLANDYASVRAYDRDGRLRVARSNISASRVNPYLGSEIPDARALGLDPDRIYRLWRHPDELAKAVPSFNSLPLLGRHVAADASDHKPNDVVGSTGSEARFTAPFLVNSLVIWAAPAIATVEDGSCRELSCAYRYRPLMRPGRTPSGEAYDGIMTALDGSHVALVPEGRAGPDVLVSDGFSITDTARRRHGLTRTSRIR